MGVSFAAAPRRRLPRLRGRCPGRIGSDLKVVLFGDLGDDVHHIRDAAAAFAALFKLPIDLGGDNDGPRIGVQELEDDVPDFPVGDDIALANEHWAKAGFVSGSADGRINTLTNLIVNVSYVAGGPGAATG